MKPEKFAPKAPAEQSRDSGLATFALRNLHFTIAVFSVLLILGAVCGYLLPKDLLPASTAAGVQVISFYPGMPTEDVEQELTYPLERYTGQAVGILRQESRSLSGVSIVRNLFQPGGDIGSATAQTGSLVMSTLRKLPPGTQPPLVLPFDPMASQPLARIVISGEGKTEADLQDLGRYSVMNAIQSVNGATAPTVMGGRLRQAIVFLDGKKLREKNLSPLRVNEKLEDMNTFLPAGEINIGDTNFQLQSNGRFSNLSEVDSFFLRSQAGVAVKIGDVGHAEDASAIQTNVVMIDGKRQVYVPVYRQLGANSLAVIDGVRDAVSHLQGALDGFKLSLVNDQTIYIRKAIDAVSTEGLLGGLLAGVMILFFLGSGQAAAAVMVTLPVSVIGAFLVLKVFGQTLNVMTLGGLALSIGVLVDNAIVVVEVILAKQEEGLSVSDAVAHGTGEVAMPVLASTVATLVVFVPAFFLQGILKTLFIPLAISVVAALGISYFSSMMIIPVLADRFLDLRKQVKKGVLVTFRNWFDSVALAYGRSLSWVLARSRNVLRWSLLLHFVIAASLLGRVGIELFPRSDAGSFTISFRAPSGLRVQKTAELASRIDARLREIIPPQDLKTIIANVGLYYGYSAAFSRNAGTQDGFISVELAEGRGHTSQFYARMLREDLPLRFPDASFSFDLGGLLETALNQGLEAPLDVQVTSATPGDARAVAARLLPEIKKVPGASDVRIRQRFDAPVLKIDMDRKKVSDLGLTPDLVVKNLVSAVSNSSSYKQNIWIDPRTGIDYLLGVQFPEKNAQSEDDIKMIPITGPAQDRSIPLGKLVTVKRGTGATEINHESLQPVIDILLDTQDRDIGGVGKDVQALVNRTPLTKGVAVSVKGEYAEMLTSVSALGWGFLLAAVLVYLLLTIQFRSFLMPAIVMTNVPKGIVGVIIALAVTGTYFSVQAAIGCIFVIGVSVSHSVLLLEFILASVRQKGNTDEAIVAASMARLRPILMTSLASILGLLPMALGMGTGSEANIPLGRAVIGGQILSTLLNFYLLPCLYRQVSRRKTREMEVQTLNQVEKAA